MLSLKPLMRCLRGARQFSTPLRQSSSWSSGPSPPRLPKEEQEIFERLQQQSTGAFSTPRNQETLESEQAKSGSTRPQINQSPQTQAEQVDARVQAAGDGEELHPDVMRGAAPEFQGEVNPKTGEVGGPKNEPLRWGPGGDYSYNGRVTDF